MKRLLFMAMIVMMSISTYAQKDSLVTNTNAEKLVDKYLAKVETLVTGLAAKLQVPAEHIYKVIVKQQLVNSLSMLFILIVTMLPALSVKWWFRKHLEVQDAYKQKHNSYYSDVTTGYEWGGYVIGIIMPCISFVIFLSWFSNIMTGIFNPEYGALKSITSMLTGM